jgi:hypothetical protein
MAKKLCLVFSVFLVFFAAAALAEERLGVPVYPGAKYDEADSKISKRNCVHITCEEVYLFVTSASIDTVSKFYKAQKDIDISPLGKKEIQETEDGGFEILYFSRATGAQIYITSPLPEYITGKKGTTLIKIFSLPRPSK